MNEANTISVSPGQTLAWAKAERLKRPADDVVTIALAAGIWNEAINLPPNTGLRGAGAHRTIVDRVGATGNAMGNISIVGLTARGTATQEGIRVVGAAQTVWIQSCRVTGGVKNITIQGRTESPGKSAQRIGMVTIERCTLLDATGDGNACGIFLNHADEYEINKTFIHRAGLGKQNALCHGIYIQKDCEPGRIFGCVIGDSSAHAIQQRGGGDIASCLCFGNPCGIYSAGRHEFSVRYNVVIEGGDIGPKDSRGWGIEIFPGDGGVRNNIVGRMSGRAPRSMWMKQSNIEYADTDGEIVVYDNTSDLPIVLHPRPETHLKSSGNRIGYVASLAEYAASRNRTRAELIDDWRDGVGVEVAGANAWFRDRMAGVMASDILAATLKESPHAD